MKGKIVLVFTILCSLKLFAQDIEISSPDGQITVTILDKDTLSLSIQAGNEKLIKKLVPQMKFKNGKTFGQIKNRKKVTTKLVNESYEAIVPTKFKNVEYTCTTSTLKCKDFDFELRVFNNGVAYRFISHLKGNVLVTNEEMDITLAQDFTCYLPEEKSLISHFENYYEKLKVSAIKNKTIAALPTLFTNNKGLSLSITESDLFDYPNLFLEKTAFGFQSLFPKYVLKTQALEKGQDRLEAVEKEADYIAKTNGKRSFPWRVFMISFQDEEIISNNLVQQLARPNELKDVSWIQPGRVAWDWWNANNIGNVNFKSGLNTETYKHYIDFAADFDLEYIILDEGWSATTLDVSKPNPDINMEVLTAYAKKKNVGIILWSLWRPLDKNMEELLSLYEGWGVKGIKVDFIQRADQYVVNFYERLAKSAAKHHLLVDFHGGMKPSGMRKAYPNIINYEAVKGLENNKWETKITPHHDALLPFTRMTAGVLDYTPGGMDNAHEDNFAVRFYRPMTLGTRAHQIALYGIYEAPLQMFADSPTNYLANKECTTFMSKIPTVWDDTIVLQAVIGEYVLLARRKDTTWYLAAITNDKSREFTVNLSFLASNKTYQLEAIEDGVNSNSIATDFKINTSIKSVKDTITVKLNNGGGYLGIFTQK